MNLEMWTHLLVSFVVIGIPSLLTAQEVEIGDYNFYVSVRYKLNHICSGAIISKNFAITAAVCVDGLANDDVAVYAGLSYNDRSNEGNSIQIKNILIMDEYDKKSLHFNVALLEFQNPLDFSGSEIGPINISKRMPSSGESYYLGLGFHSESGESNEKLRKSSVDREDSECYEEYEMDVIVENICSFPVESMDTCQVEDGSPLIGDNKLIGIFGFSYGCNIYDSTHLNSRLLSNDLTGKKTQKFLTDYSDIIPV